MTMKEKNSQTTSQKNPEKNAEKSTRPVQTFRCGAIAASIWRRQTATGFEYLDFSLSRSWKTKNGLKEGYSQGFFEHNDEPLVSVIREAAEFIRGYPLETEPRPTGDSPPLCGTNGAAAAG